MERIINPVSPARVAPFAASLLKPDRPCWYAVYTRPRAERKVAERLEKEGIRAYCPTYTTIRKWSDRRKKVVLPVLACYVFVQVRLVDYKSVLQDPGVVQYVYFQGKPAMIQNREMKGLMRFLGDLKERDKPVVRPIQQGDRVAIQQGPLAGLEGVVKDRTRRKAFLLLEPLGVVVEIEERYVAPASAV